MLTDADIVAAIQGIAETFRIESANHAKWMVRYCNDMGDPKARGHERLSKRRKEKAFGRLLGQCQSLADHGHGGLAKDMLQQAIDNANLAEQLASVQALDAIPLEAA